MAKNIGKIIGGIAALGVIGAVLAPDTKIESIELSIPDYQTEYDINTQIPIDVAIFPEDASSSSLEYIVDGDGIIFSETGINTGMEEGTYELHILSDDIASNTISINVVDITARDEALAKEQAEKEAEEKRLAKEQAAKEAEEKRLAKEQAAKEAEEQRLAKEQAEKKANEQKTAKEQTEKELAAATAPETETPKATTTPENQNTAVEQSAPTESSGGNGNSGGSSNFNTYNNEDQQNTEATYVLNTSTHKIHHPSCSSVKKIASKNYATSNESVDALIAQGYSTCGNCFK